MEDHLDEALNVLQRHASGQGTGSGLNEIHSRLVSGLALPPGFTNAALGVSSRLTNLVGNTKITTACLLFKEQ